MKLYEYVIRVKDQFSDKFQKLSAAAGQSESKVVAVRRRLGQTEKSAISLNSAFGTLGRTLAGVFAVGALVSFTADVKAVTAEFDSLERSITFASGSSLEGSKNMQFLHDITDRMGLPLQASVEGFKTLAGGMMGTALQGEGTRKIFEGVSTGVVAMGLSAEQAKGAYLALGQMMSKGTVQAEELRGQLAERIPGAFDAAARAMGVTKEELNKMMDDGKLISEQFLPRFAEEMQRTFGDAMPEATRSLTANTARMNNQWLLTKKFLGDQLMPIFQGSVILLANLARGVRENWEQITQLVTIIGVAGGVFLAYRTAVLATNLVIGAYLGVTTLVRMANVLMVGGFSKLNMVLRLNPIGLVVTALTVLVGVMVWAYNKFDWFRGGVWGLWEAFKEVFSAIGDIAKNILGGVMDMVIGLFDWDTERMKAGFGNLTKGLLAANPVGFATAYGKDIASAAARGFEEGKKKDPLSFGAMFGMGGSTDGLAGASGGSGSDEFGAGADLSDGIDSIAGGGGRVMNVTVNVGKFMDKIEIHSTVAEAADEIEAKIREVFVRVINGGIYSATQ